MSKLLQLQRLAENYNEHSAAFASLMARLRATEGMGNPAVRWGEADESCDRLKFFGRECRFRFEFLAQSTFDSEGVVYAEVLDEGGAVLSSKAVLGFNRRGAIWLPNAKHDTKSVDDPEDFESAVTRLFSALLEFRGVKAP